MIRCQIRCQWGGGWGGEFQLRLTDSMHTQAQTHARADTHTHTHAPTPTPTHASLASHAHPLLWHTRLSIMLSASVDVETTTARSPPPSLRMEHSSLSRQVSLPAGAMGAQGNLLPDGRIGGGGGRQGGRRSACLQVRWWVGGGRGAGVCVCVCVCVRGGGGAGAAGGRGGRMGPWCGVGGRAVEGHIVEVDKIEE